MSQAGSLNNGGGSGGSNVQTLTGNTGGAVPPTANNINVVGSGDITVVGNPGTSTLTISSNAVTGVSSVIGTADQILASPTTGNVVLSLIGPYTPSSYTSDSLLLGNGISSITSLGAATNGQIPIGSTGASPILSTITAGSGITVTNGSGSITIASSGGSGITTIDGDSGSVTGSTVTIETLPGTNGGSPIFTGSGTVLTLSFSDGSNNTYIGQATPVGGTGSDNTGFGSNVFTAASGMTGCCAFGYLSQAQNTSGTSCCSFGQQTMGHTGVSGDNSDCNAFGLGALYTCESATKNNAFGYAALNNISSGSYNSAFGDSAGTSYTSSESSNIVIGNAGVVSESNVIRIGTQGSSSGEQNACYVAGIFNTNSSGFTSPLPVFVDSSTGQLGYGSSGGSGITTIDGDSGSVTGSTVTITGASTAGATVKFVGSGTTLSLDTSDGSGITQRNTFIGLSAGNSSYTGSKNTGVGYNTLHAITSGTFNAAFGGGALTTLTTGTGNMVLGQGALQTANGSYNVGIGYTVGINYTGTESSNILIQNEGVLGENNVIRIGNQGTGNTQQNVCYIAGIEGATYSAGSPTPALTYCDTSDGQLVSTQAVASATATSTFGSLVVGTGRQNTATYAILVNVSMVITAATGATIVMGIGSTSTPSTNTVVTTFTVAAAATYSFSGFVPAGYYMLVNTTGTITVGSITTQTCAVG